MPSKQKTFLVAFAKTLITGLACIIIFLLANLLFPIKTTKEFSTIVTDNKDEIIHVFLTSDDKWRLKTELNEISPLLRKTIVFKEDKHFYKHPGINPFSMIRAAFMNLTRMRRTSGASTITMQVVRALEPRKRNLGNKMIEMFRAVQLEAKLSKDEILQLYLNLVPYGGNIEGVKSASLLYLNKSPNHLSLSEITALSIIPNRPSSLVPGRNNDKIIKERDRYLRLFFAEGLFNKEEIEDAISEPFNAQRGSFPRLAPHLSHKLRSTGQDLIRTNIDMETQFRTEKLVADYVRIQRLKGIMNAAVVIIDNKSGNIITYAGSSDFYDTLDGGQVNGAEAVRQPGSTLKPLLYALAIDEGLLTPKKTIADVQVNYSNYAPENYDKKFNGPVSIEKALEQSLNVPAVRSLRMIGKEKMISSLTNCGFKQIERDRNKLGLSMVLGGCGATLEELTGLFSIFAHEGKFFKPKFLRSEGDTEARTIISAASAFMINEILSRITRPDFPINWQATEKMPRIAWKTGTSYGRRDAWSIGYNKNFTVGVWLGNFSGVGISELSGTETATPLLFRIFNTIDYDGDHEWFTQPQDCEMRKVCSESGMVPADHCENVVMDYFIPLISQNHTCNDRQEFLISADEKNSFCKTCAPTAGFKKKIYKLIQPEVQSWLDENLIAYEKIPPHNPVCEQVFSDSGPRIVSPVNGFEYLIDRSDPEPVQLSCKTSNEVSRVFWYINDEFYRASPAAEKQFFVPVDGRVKISCTDDKGRNTNVWINVKKVNL